METVTDPRVVYSVPRTWKFRLTCEELSETLGRSTIHDYEQWDADTISAEWRNIEDMPELHFTYCLKCLPFCRTLDVRIIKAVCEVRGLGKSDA